MAYKNFGTALYFIRQGIDRFEDLKDFDNQFTIIEKHIEVNKLYLETFRSSQFVDDSKIRAMKDHLNAKGIETSGGITLNVESDGTFKSFCYTDEAHLEILDKVIAYTATLFDEVILDDFYFTNCKCDACIEDKGNQNWSDYRTKLLARISERIMTVAKDANPNVSMVIKYPPNWYEDYQTTGYNLDESAECFDALYTGTETRDTRNTQQNLQPYLSYFLMRYLENVKPEKNLGGWFDTYDCSYNPATYLDQLNLTLLAGGAKEATLFCMSNLMFQHDMFVPMAGYGFDRMDGIIGQLGQPVGIACYKPYHSRGENYLHNFIGMLGLPLEPKPHFDETAPPLILLTQSAAYDQKIVEKMKKHMQKGNTVLITTGLLKALGNSVKDLIQVDYTDKKVSVDTMANGGVDIASYSHYEPIAKPILLPQIEHSTNDAWQEIVGIKDEKSYPILLRMPYSQGGELYVLTVPDDYNDLYKYPVGALNHLRNQLMKDSPVRIEGGDSKVSLFTYDNKTFVIQSFLDHKTRVQVVCRESSSLQLLEGQNSYRKSVESGYVKEGKRYFDIVLEARSYVGYRYVES